MTECDPGRQEFTEMGRRHKNFPLIIKKKNVGWIYVNILREQQSYK